MAEIRVAAQKAIAAPAAQVYSYIADFELHHPNFLPPAFSDLRIEEGGKGAGTVVSYKLKAGPRERSYRMRVDEPEPGSVLTESDLGSSLVTTFRVIANNGTSEVQIETRWQGAGGIGGLMERLFAPRFLRRLYKDELGRLDDYARHLSSGE